MIGTLSESFSSISQSVVPYTSTAAQILTTGAMQKRSAVMICNNSASTLYVSLGPGAEGTATSEVSTSEYLFQLTEGQTVTIGAKENIGIFLVGSGSGNAYVLEVAS